LPTADKGKGPLFLGLASFLYYTKQYGYECQMIKGDNLMFNEAYVSFKIYEYPEQNRIACGCVLTSVNDIYTVFAEEPELIKILEEKCPRIRWGIPTKNPHCKLDKSLWGKLPPVEIDKGRWIRCYKIP
jgi:hypothetical protein